jgi:hypothetical protein
MTCGCASEPVYDGYRQYEDYECKWCTSCNRIFCLIHAKIHGKLYRKNKMLPMSYTPEKWNRKKLKKYQKTINKYEVKI